MADLTPAEELRAAAARLREHAQAASAHPGLAAPLAAWLESWGDIEIREAGPMAEDLQHALTVARAILGGGRG